MAGVEVPIKITTQGGQDAAKQFDVLEKNVLDARKELEKFGDATADANVLRSRFEMLGMDIKDTAKQARQLNDALQTKIDDPYENVERGLKGVEEQAKRTKLSLSRDSLGLGDESLKQGAKNFGDLSGGFSGLAQASGAIDQRVGNFVQNFSDFTQLTEYLPRLVSGFASLSISAVPLLGTTAALALGAAYLNKEMQQSVKNIKDLAQEERDRVKALIQTREDLRSLSADQARQQLDDLQFSLDAQKAALDASISGFEGEISNIRSFGDSATTAASGLGALAGLDFGVFGVAKTEIEKYNEEIKSTNDEIERLSKEVLPELLQIQRGEFNRQTGNLQSQRVIDELTAQRDRTLELQEIIATSTSENVQAQIDGYDRQKTASQNYINGLKSQLADAESTRKKLLEGDLSNPETIRQIEELTGQITSFTNELSSAEQSLQATNQSIADLGNVALPTIKANEQLTAAMERQRATLDSLRSDIEKTSQSLTDFVSSEKQAQARKAAEAQLKATRSAEEGLLKSRYDSLIAAREQAKSQQKLKDVEADRVNKITDINIKFFNDSLKRTQEFYLKEKRSQEDANLERLRMVEDLQADLFEASAANNVDAFITRLRSGNRDISRFDQDTSIDARRRAEDFALSNNDAIANRQKEVEAVQQASAAKLQAEQEAATKSLTLEQQYQAELANLKARYQQEDLRRQQEFDRQASLTRYNALITQLNEQQRLQAEAQKALAQNAAVAGQNAGVSLLNSFQQTVMNRGGVTNAAANVIPRVNFTAFGDGGNVTSPTFSLLGEREGWGDLVMPYKKSEGLPAGLSRPSITVDFRGANLGGISPEVLDSKLNNFASQIVNGLNQGFSA